MFWLISEYRGAFAGLPRANWYLALAAFINRCGKMVLPFLSIYLTKKLGLSATMAGVMLSTYGVGAIAGSWIGGKLTDRYDPVIVQIVSLFTSGISLVLLGYASSVATIAVALIVAATLTEAFRPANLASVAAFAPADLRPRAYGLNRLAVNAGMSIGPAVGGFLALQNYLVLFWVDGITCALSAGVLLLVLKQLRAPPLAEKEKKDGGREWFSDRVFVAILALTVLIGLLFFQYESTQPLYFKEIYLLNEDRIGLLFAVNTFMIIAFEMLLTRRLENYSALWVIAVGMIFFGLGFGLMPFGRSFGFAAFTVVVWTIGEMMLAPRLTAFVADRAGPGRRGSYMAMNGIAYATALIVAPTIGMSIYQNIGPDFVFYGCAVVGLLSFLGFGWLAIRLKARGEPH